MIRLNRALPGVLALCVLPVLASATPAQAGPAQAAPARAAVKQRYVALGDSFTAGPLIPGQNAAQAGCLRSDQNYPSLVAKALKPAKFADVSCSYAMTKNMTAPQGPPFGPNPAQFGALTKDTTLVTIGIGGNDVGFGELALTCGFLGASDPLGAPCAKRFGHQFDKRIAALGPKVGAVLKGIHARSPKARVLVVGYLRVLPKVGGCWPILPISVGDITYINRFEQALNDMLARQARTHGAGFVDAFRGGIGHDACSFPTDRWVEGAAPTTFAAPAHPNAAGMKVVADRVLTAVRAGHS